MEAASKVPPAVYVPELVAEAICYAAEHPIRSVMIGGAGRIMIWAARLFPRLTDRLYSAAFFITAKDKSRPPREQEGDFYAPAARVRSVATRRTICARPACSRSSAPIRRRRRRRGRSGYRRRPLASWLLKPKAQGEQQSTAQPDETGSPSAFAWGASRKIN